MLILGPVSQLFCVFLWVGGYHANRLAGTRWLGSSGSKEGGAAAVAIVAGETLPQAFCILLCHIPDSQLKLPVRGR